MPEIVFCCMCGRLIPQADIDSKVVLQASGGLLCRKCSEAAVASTGKMVRPAAARSTRRERDGRTAQGSAAGAGSGANAGRSTVAIRPLRPKTIEAKLTICAAATVIGLLIAAILWPGGPEADRKVRPKKGIAPEKELLVEPSQKPHAVRTPKNPPSDPFAAPKVRLPLNTLEWEAEAAEALRKTDEFAAKNPTLLEEALERYEAMRREYPGSRAELDAENRILKLKAAIGLRRDGSPNAEP